MKKGFTHPYCLRSFIDEIVRTKGAALAGTIAPPTAEAVEAEFKAAALASAQAFFGASTPIAVDLVTGSGEVRFYQVLRAVERAADPKTEIDLRTLKAAGEEFVNVDDGELVRFRIDHGDNPIDGVIVEAMERRVGHLVPLPMRAPGLYGPLTEALNRIACRYFPPPHYPEDTLGWLLTSDGGWTKGVRASLGDKEVWVEGASFEFYRTEVNRGWVRYGFMFGVRANGQTRRVRFVDTSPYDSIDHGLPLPTSAAAKSSFIEALGQEIATIANLTDVGEERSARLFIAQLLKSALRPPIAEGFWDWLRHEMPVLLRGATHEVVAEGGAIRLDFLEFIPPALALTFGSSTFRMKVTSSDPAIESGKDGLWTGRLAADSLSLRGPADEAERRDLERIVAVFRDWVIWQVDHRFAQRRSASDGMHHSFFGFRSTFPLVELLAQRLRWGPPGEVPVPLFDDAALSRAARMVKAVSRERRGGPKKGTVTKKAADAHTLATFTVMDWTVVLEDDTKNSPWGSHLGISLLAPGETAPVQVLQVDPWNPPSILVIDGDAFAFERFVTWLREAILRGGNDATVKYRCADDDETPKRRRGRELTLSDWLRFGTPDTGDRFLVDWRAQSNTVPARVDLEAFRPIFGFGPERIERLRTRDIPLWRRFLREVIDPRFVHTSGERVASARSPSLIPEELKS